MVKEDISKDYDVIAVENNYISVTPIHYDLTDYNMLEEMKKWKF